MTRPNRRQEKDRPEPGKQYRLTGAGPSIQAGNTWSESEVKPEPTLEEVFGPVISRYTRKQALEDGVLADVTNTEAGKLFKYPTAITSDLFDALKRGNGAKPETYAARLWDVLYMSRHGKIEGSDSWFKVIVGNRTLELRCNCGPDDEGAPCMTIGFPGDF